MVQRVLDRLVQWEICETVAQAEETYGLLEEVLGLHAARHVTLEVTELHRLTQRCTELLEKLTAVPALLTEEFPGDDMRQALRNAQRVLDEPSSPVAAPSAGRLRRVAQLGRKPPSQESAAAIGYLRRCALTASDLLDLVGVER
ncbi:hypothetical protein [Streptomyces sp. NPDC015125]|uniref:hypothetical protein n=1 Tax=Streptomyces sp. NPDC015125 TaxID=3364938 RepID=UPI003700CA1D